MRKRAYILVFFSVFSGQVFSQLQVTPSNNATQLAQTLAGAGVTISGATMNCPSVANNAAGTFVGTASNIGIAQGVLLTSGSVANAVGPNVQTSITTINNVTFNDPDLMAIDPNAIYDVCILEFNAVPSCDTLRFTFAFGSDEYPEFVGSIFNDAYGIFVTGPNPSGPAYAGYNMARIPVTQVPVAINTVNNGTNCPSTGPCSNCAYYVDNCTNGPTVEYDGFTIPITVRIPVVPCGTYHFKLAIADAGDMAYDSGVFFAMQSLVCNTTLTVTATSTNVTCAGNNGTATVTSVLGGQSPYTYVWNSSPPQTAQTATGLAPGNYTVTVIDANGCLSGTQTVTVGNSGGSFTVTPTQNNVTCFGANNASASITNPTGGNAPYTYSWSTNPVQTTPTISNIPAGNYTCTITDATGCVQTQTFTITQPAAVTATITNTTNVSCFGGNNGSATASGAGGTGTINYLWNTSPAQASATASNLVAGSYVVTVTDANGCTATANVTITQPQGMSVTTSSTPSACGINDGTASVSSSGGATPHTYLWLTNPVQTSPTATGLGGGQYTIIVTDANGCTQQQQVTVGGGIPPVADFNFVPSDVISLLDPIVVFTDLSNGNPTLWSWNFGDPNSGSNDSSSLQHPMHVYSDTGTYCIRLIISDNSGICRDTVVKCLRVEAPYTIYVPNAFTPNSDGWNEFFTAYGTYIKEFEMHIFDRWGNQIWSCHTMGEPQMDSNCRWNGKMKKQGDLVQEDVYVWKVNILDAYNKKHKYVGHVTMVR